mgnify:CR=1 FL=1
MTDPVGGKGKVESLVKEALKEAMEKRRLAVAEVEPSTLVSTMINDAIKVTTPAAVPAVLEASQKYFSEVLGDVSVTSNEDFPVSCFHSYAWDDRVAFLIPEVDLSYVIDKKLARSVLMAWEMGDRVLAYGPTGAGKSSLIEQLCARTHRPFLRVNCTGDMDSSMIFGQLTAKDGSTLWEDGAVTEAVKCGAVFAWDEWDVTPPEISMGLQWLLEDNGKLLLKEKPGAIRDKQITPHEHFRIVAIGNTQGQGDDTGSHAGTNVQNTATLDRFGTAVYVDYLQPDIEEKMILNKWETVISRKAAKELVKLANLIRQGYKAGQFNLTISPRTLFSICKKLSKGTTLREAFTVTYLNKLNDTQRKVADELFVKIYGTAV